MLLAFPTIFHICIMNYSSLSSQIFAKLLSFKRKIETKLDVLYTNEKKMNGIWNVIIINC